MSKGLGVTLVWLVRSGSLLRPLGSRSGSLVRPLGSRSGSLVRPLGSRCCWRRLLILLRVEHVKQTNKMLSNRDIER